MNDAIAGMQTGNLMPLIDLWPDPVLVLNSEGGIVAVSQAALHVTQWKADKIIGHKAHAILCADTYDQHHAEYECPVLALTRGDARESAHAESMYWINGDDVHISVDFRAVPAPMPGHTLIMFKVLTPGEYNQSELKKLARLCEVTPAPLLEVGADSSIHFANPAMIKLMVDFGFDVSGAAELLPDNLPQLVHECISKSKPLLNIEKNLRQHTFLWQLFPYRHGGDVTVLLTGNDLTDQFKATQRAKLSERQLLIERERMRREYIAKMVHDLRSPLNAIVGFGSMLQHSLDGRIDKDETDMLDFIVKGGRDLAEQISESLAQARIEAAQMNVTLLPTPLQSIIENVANMLAPLASEKNLRLAHCCDPLEVTADSRMLGQALTNLIANAIKFTTYGSVTLEAHRVDARFYVITISDTGCGIPSEDLSSIFSPYSRQKRHDSEGVEGQGLGLAIVSDIVNLHGGSISVESSVGKGTRFTLRMPISP